MESDCLCLDLAILDVHFVATQHDGDVLAYPHQIPVPIGHVLVRDSGRNVEHYDRTLSLNVVAIPQPSEFLLAGRIPYVETNRASVCVENQRVDFHSQRCCKAKTR